MKLRIATWNMQGTSGNKSDKIRKMLRDGIDLVCLQEFSIGIAKDLMEKSVYLEWQVKEIGGNKRCSMAIIFNKHSYIISHYKIGSAIYYEGMSDRRRPVIWMLVKLSGHEAYVVVYCVHAPSSGDATAFKYFVDIIIEIKKHYDNLKQFYNCIDWFMTGDFNCEAKYMIEQLKNANLKDLIVHRTGTSTMRARIREIDYFISEIKEYSNYSVNDKIIRKFDHRTIEYSDATFSERIKIKKNNWEQVVTVGKREHDERTLMFQLDEFAEGLSDHHPVAMTVDLGVALAALPRELPVSSEKIDVTRNKMEEISNNNPDVNIIYDKNAMQIEDVGKNYGYLDGMIEDQIRPDTTRMIEEFK